MNPVIETGALIAATIIVGVTLWIVPAPRHKPPEIDKPQPVEVPPPPPSPQDVVSQTTNITVPTLTPEQSEKQRLANIELKLMHIQQQVQRMEKKVE